MIVIGLICLLLGWLLGVSVLFVVGLILLVVGAVLAVAGGVGHSIGGRRFWY